MAMTIFFIARVRCGYGGRPVGCARTELSRTAKKIGLTQS
jgi:hypothetical protein